MKIYDSFKNKLKYKRQKQIRNEILKKYRIIVPEENMWLLSDELLKIFERNSSLSLSVLSKDWNIKSYQTFLKQSNINLEACENILIMKEELFETDIFDYIDLNFITKSPELYYDLYVNHNKEKLIAFLNLNIKSNSKEINSDMHIFSNFIDYSHSVDKIFDVISNYRNLCIEILSFTDIEMQKKLFDLLVQKKEENCNNIIHFMKKYQIDKIGNLYYPIFANIDDIKKIERLIDENSDLLEIIKTKDNVEKLYEIDDKLYNLYFEVIPESEFNNQANEFYKEKLSYLLFDCGIDYIKISFNSSWKEIFEIANYNQNKELLNSMKIFELLQQHDNNEKELKDFYSKYKDEKILKRDEFVEQLLSTYSQKLNHGLFNPNSVPDEIGIHGDYEVTYIPYKDKKIKKIIVRDPDFYMDVTNVVDWSGNSSKDRKIIEMSQKIIKNPELYGTIQNGSNTVCTSLINRKKMRTFANPIVTGGFAKIDYRRLILTKNGDAGTNDRVEKDSIGSFESISNMLSSSSSLCETGYNEVTYHRHYYDDGEWKSQKFDYMTLCPNSKWMHEEIDQTLEWAYTYDIPLVEIDSKFMYEYSRRELEQLVFQLYQSTNVITLSDVCKIIELISSMNSFLPRDQYVEYCFTDIMDYIISWGNKKYTYEDLEELENIFHSHITASTFLINDIKYGSKEIDEVYTTPIFKEKVEALGIRYETARNLAINDLINIKSNEKNTWVKNWVNRIEVAKENLTENHKKFSH